MRLAHCIVENYRQEPLLRLLGINGKYDMSFAVNVPRPTVNNVDHSTSSGEGSDDGIASEDVLLFYVRTRFP